MDIIKIYSDIYGQYIESYNDYIFNHSIKNNKLWEEYLVNYIVEYLENNTDFLDIGANIGLITLGVIKKAISMKKNINKIHCFECDVKTFNILYNNTSNIDNICYYPFALADKNMLCNMSINKNNYGCNHIYTTNDGLREKYYNYSFIPSSNIKMNKIYCPSVPLDSILYQFNNKIGVIKIDVEGFEANILNGAKCLINIHRPIIILEIWENTQNDIDRIMNELNYYDKKFIGNENYIFFPK
jgi:FkbM family methyltransferase